MSDSNIKDYYMLLWERDGVIEGSHGVFKSENEAMESIYAWWDINGFEPFFVRTWVNANNDIKVDYGSHHNFYLIRKVNRENFNGVYESNQHVRVKEEDRKEEKKKLNMKWIDFFMENSPMKINQKYKAWG